MNRNLNIFCLNLLHGKHMMRGKGNKKVHKCMMPHCSELPIRIHIFNRVFVNFLGSVQLWAINFFLDLLQVDIIYVSIDSSLLNSEAVLSPC
jgi:hypothetical protein